MDGIRAWPIVGLAFGAVLGLAGAFGGFGAFVLVLVLGLLGYVAGRAIDGDLDLAALFGRRT